MDESETAKELEDQATPPQADGEPASTQNPPQDSTPFFHLLSTGSPSEQDIQEPPIASNHQEKDSPVARASLTVADAETSLETASRRGEEENVQRPRGDSEQLLYSPATEQDSQDTPIASNRQDKDSPSSRASLTVADAEMTLETASRGEENAQRPRDDSQQFLYSPESSSLPTYPQNSPRSWTGGMIDPQAQLGPRDYAYIPRAAPAPFMADPRSFALGQLTAAAELKLSPGSLRRSDNQGRKRPFQYDEEDEEEPEWYHQKKKKSRGSKGKQAERWDQMFARLVNFKNLHGHCLVPNRYPEDPSLGAWVSTQRRHYKLLTSGDPNQTTPMTPERASRLMSIGFKWATKDPRHVPWDIRFQQLLEYKEEYGDCVVPIGFKENPRLSNWVSQQRQEYKLLQQGKKARISAEHIRALDAVGFVWEAQRGCNRKKKKRKHKKESSVAMASPEGASDAASPSPSHLARQSSTIPHPNESSQDIPPAILSHVLSLLGAQGQSNMLQAGGRGASMAAAAARMTPSVARRPPPPHVPNLLPTASLHRSPSRQIGGAAFNDAWAHQIQDPRNRLLALNAASMRNIIQEQIITKHLIDALRRDQSVGSTGIGEAVQRINGILGHQGRAAESSPRRITQNNEAQQRALRMPDYLPPALRGVPTDLAARDRKLRADRTESESEASKFGVALQVGEVMKEGVEEMVKKSSALAHGVGIPPAMRNLGMQDFGGVAPRAETLEGHKKPARLVADSHSGPRRNATTAKGRGSPSLTLGSIPNWSAKRSSSSGTSAPSNDDEGIFSDAEEDEAGMAFLGKPSLPHSWDA